ncbi:MULTISPECIES: sarcosine oxidase subunit gamma family protein [unclassified Mesorhizobium]|uniref:sarcosine oxidase subunit gamma n=1 Tax=unclassified Mesorhizobium TaxID=325217 RepID=UPI001CCD800F|nr:MULTISPECIES: sarcosine oxidase subunit gamma family protein [unclassified Mesorhizobium]MCA0000107.1 sarcosine oxidase subunit gamma [Mesorhizobium sp. B264B2A]MCA0006158.1 sarcosine oxidase subunit gamma [Mesorhizobium sp. B264B1B]MCA0021828.1 sarcosine oxidase subunit gamma [Mesorhizobium sp. B264B1A]MCA0028709.1 sarcosine oxidase subunit gamma [Mesorhizobium sp. B263B1A]
MVEPVLSKDFNLWASDCPIIQIEGWDGTLARFETSVSQALGARLPASVGETVRHAGALIVRIAPRRLWLIVETGAEPPAIAIDPELGCSVLLGEGRVRFRMEGARLQDILSACMPVDWSSAASAPGRAVQTSIHHVPALYLRTGESSCDLIVPRSFAISLADWIAAAR